MSNGLPILPGKLKAILVLSAIVLIVLGSGFVFASHWMATFYGPAGRVVNISSSTAKVAIPLLGAYSSSKSGLEGMSEVLRRELMLFGIGIVIIEPGTVTTAMYARAKKKI